MSSQEDCRNETARTVNGGETARPVAESQTSPIAQRFADCMTKEGWHLSTPKPGQVAVNNPPTGSPSTNPSAALAVPVRQPGQQNYPPPSAYPPASSYPVYNGQTGTYNSAYYPPSGAPSVNPSAAAAVAPVASVARTAPVAAAAPTAATAVARPALSAAPAAPTAASAATNAVASTAASKAAASVTASPAVQPQTTIPTSPDVATYQPGRPSGEAQPYYGTGPGRQF